MQWIPGREQKRGACRGEHHSPSPPSSLVDTASPTPPASVRLSSTCSRISFLSSTFRRAPGNARTAERRFGLGGCVSWRLSSSGSEGSSRQRPIPLRALCECQRMRCNTADMDRAGRLRPVDDHRVVGAMLTGVAAKAAGHVVHAVPYAGAGTRYGAGVLAGIVLSPGCGVRFDRPAESVRVAHCAAAAVPAAPAAGGGQFARIRRRRCRVGSVRALAAVGIGKANAPQPLAPAAQQAWHLLRVDGAARAGIFTAVYAVGDRMRAAVDGGAQLCGACRSGSAKRRRTTLPAAGCYRYGGDRQWLEHGAVATPQARWIGPFADDWRVVSAGGAAVSPIPLRPAAVRLARSLLHEAQQQGDEMTARELAYMGGPDVVGSAAIDSSPAGASASGTFELQTVMAQRGASYMAHEFVPRIVLRTLQQDRLQRAVQLGASRCLSAGVCAVNDSA
eukprot:ctg_1132.g367